MGRNKDKLFNYLKQIAEKGDYGTSIHTGYDIANFGIGKNWIIVKELRDKFMLELENLGYNLSYANCGADAFININWLDNRNI